MCVGKSVYVFVFVCVCVYKLAINIWEIPRGIIALLTKFYLCECNCVTVYVCVCEYDCVCMCVCICLSAGRKETLISKLHWTPLNIYTKIKYSHFMGCKIWTLFIKSWLGCTHYEEVSTNNSYVQKGYLWSLCY